MTNPSARQVELRWDPQKLDKKWQGRWDDDQLYQFQEDDPRPKWYELTMYPYPSGDAHIGHWYAMAPADCHARFRRMQGYNVLHPMGFDAFGLPAENAAIRRGIHPHTWTMANIERMRSQLRSMGPIYDWGREVVCALPEYYRWNQWLFLQFYKSGLAYRARAPVVWCTSCQTVLANEQVIENACERCQTPITRRELDQWFLRITNYAEELLDFSNLPEWPTRIRTMQQNWIGRSPGVEVDFDISHLGLEQKTLSVFTTRVDTLYGVTFIVLAPEHPLVTALTAQPQKLQVNEYVEAARRKSDIERLSAEREKTGVFLGNFCVNNIDGTTIPLFVADYAVSWYAQGAVMGVPAHDQRDFEFASKYKLPIKVVIAPPGWDEGSLAEAYVGAGLQVNSAQFDGLPNEQAIEDITDYLEQYHWGKRTITYRIRDWLISRQRYWGTPIPIVHCPQCGTVPIPDDQIPVLLPEDAEFKPTGESPLRNHKVFVNVLCPQCKAHAERETDTMDTFFDSSWYFLRYLSPHDEEKPWDQKIAKKWMPVDQYTGGAEHAVMHLLYARFFIKALRDMGLVEFDEPFQRLFNQGHIIADGTKMSKSRGNVVTPDPYVEALGADIVRTYLMFVGPWERGGEWSDAGINGVARWMNRVWDLAHRDFRSLPSVSPDSDGRKQLARKTHQTIRKVYNDLDLFKFNTAIASLMELTNSMQRAWEMQSVDPDTWQDTLKYLLLLLAPIAPHVTEELWEHSGKDYSIHNCAFPKWDDQLAEDEVVTLIVQVNGRVREKISVSADIEEEEAKALACEQPNVIRHLEEKQVQRIIYVKGRLVNIVTS